MNKLDEIIKRTCPNGVKYKTIGEIIIKQPKSKYGVARLNSLDSGKYPAFTSGNKLFSVDEFLVDGENIFMNDGGQADTKYYNGKACYSDHVFAFTSKEVNVRYLYHYLLKLTDEINKNYFRGGGIKNLIKKDFLKIEIPIPDMEAQCEIVRILDNFAELTAELTAELSFRKSQYDFYRNNLFSKYRNCKKVSIQKIFPFIRNGFVGTVTPFFTSKELGIRYLEGTNIHNGIISDNSNLYINKDFHHKHIKNELKSDDILIVQSGHIGDCAVVGEKYKGANCHALVIMSNGGCVNSQFYVHYFHTYDGYRSFKPAITDGNLKHLLAGKMKFVMVPEVDIIEQNEIVKHLDNFQKYNEDINDGLPAEIKYRQQQYEYYRDKLLTFKRLEN